MSVNQSPPRRNWADCWASKIRDRLERWSTGGALGMAGPCRGVRAMNQNSCPREVRRGKTPRKWPPGCCESSHSRGISFTVLFLGAVSCYPLMEPVRLSAEGPVPGDSAPGVRQEGPLTLGWIPMTSPYSGGPAPLSRHQIVERLRHASAWVIVSIEQGQKWGTAWLADGPERLLVTNHHVVAPTDLSLLDRLFVFESPRS
jgi:hypothetical protein